MARQFQERNKLKVTNYLKLLNNIDFIYFAFQKIDSHPILSIVTVIGKPILSTTN